MLEASLLGVGNGVPSVSKGMRGSMTKLLSLDIRQATDEYDPLTPPYPTAAAAAAASARVLVEIA